MSLMGQNLRLPHCNSNRRCPRARNSNHIPDGTHPRCPLKLLRRVRTQPIAVGFVLGALAHDKSGLCLLSIVTREASRAMIFVATKIDEHRLRLTLVVDEAVHKKANSSKRHQGVAGFGPCFRHRPNVPIEEYLGRCSSMPIRKRKGAKCHELLPYFAYASRLSSYWFCASRADWRARGKG
jgi:hypothetical protein